MLNYLFLTKVFDFLFIFFIIPDVNHVISREIFKIMVEELPNPCKVGIFGTGPLVRALLPHIKRNFEVVAIWGTNDSDLEEEAISLNISIYSSHEDDVLLNKDIGLLIILCPPIHHAQIAVKALGTFKHVYVHPPCATSAPQTLRMVQSAAYYPNLVAVVGSLRSLPAVQEMKRLIKEGYLGTEIIHCDLRLQSPPLIQKKYSWKCSEVRFNSIYIYMYCKDF